MSIPTTPNELYSSSDLGARPKKGKAICYEQNLYFMSMEEMIKYFNKKRKSKDNESTLPI